MIEIPLTQNQVALIDDEDFELVSKYKWYALWDPHMKSFYAVTNIRKPDEKRTGLKMHRLIMNAQPCEQVDHIHRFTLDNRKSELRLCTNGQNARNKGAPANNTSGFKGVSWDKRDQKWRAQIQIGGKKKNLGLYDAPEFAHEAYCTASARLHGAFANFGDDL